MVDQIEQLAKVLETDGLEIETSALINLAIREQVELYRAEMKAPAPPNVADVLSRPDVMDEWVNGAQGGE